MTALYVCYLGFLVRAAGRAGGVAGRQLHPATLTGYVIVPVQRFIMAKGDPVGACFPSAHVAGAWTATVRDPGSIFGRGCSGGCCRSRSGLTVAVVYTRYHYLSDAIAGLAVAVACSAGPAPVPHQDRELATLGAASTAARPR